MKSRQKRLCVQCNKNSNDWCDYLSTNNIDVKIDKCYHNVSMNHLKWIYDRLVNVYGENEDAHHMIRFKNIINKLK